MRQHPETRLSLHEIFAPLGAGEMDEVGEAKDARLSREVVRFIRRSSPETRSACGELTKFFQRPLHVSIRPLDGENVKP